MNTMVMYDRSMNNIIDTNKTLEIEWHQLELRYTALRIHTESATRRLMLSIDEYGLLTPIVVVASGVSGRPWLVIDGYLRIAAYKKLDFDLITAVVWEASIPDSLLYSYQYNASRPWEKLEEANLIQELLTLHGYSQIQLAQLLGKSASWISYRVQLTNDLLEFLRLAIYKGRLSSWTATRILIPFARANSAHAEQFVNYLYANKHSSRDIQSFYEHYLRSNRNVRAQIAKDPSLFFKISALKKLESTEKCDKLAPEYIWDSKITQIISCLHTLESILLTVFYQQQPESQQRGLIEPFENLISRFELLQQSVRSKINA